MARLSSLFRGLRIERRNVVPDIVAGATFAIVNVPQGMANAVLASVNPVAGLYALMIAMPVGALFTSSIYMNVSTTGALSVAAGEALYGIPENDKIPALVALVIMIGAAQLLMGLLRFGRLVRYVSNSVMTGFITGIAILIVLGSLPDITGYQSELSNHFLRLGDTLLNWRSFDFAAVCFGVATIVLIFAAQATSLAKFSLIIALAAVTLLVQFIGAMFSLGATELVGDVATIPRSLPAPLLPNLDYLPDLILPAVAIAVIGLVQGAGVGQSYPNPDGRFPDTSQDFVGQGAANMAASVFGAIPSGGSMSGTAVNVQAGARTRWSNIFAGLIVIVIVFFLVDLVKLVPMAGLGGLLFVVGFQNISLTNISMIWSTGMLARMAMLATLLATLLMPLQYAILFGIALSFVLQVLRTSNQIEVRQLSLVEDGFPTDLPGPTELAPNEASVLRVRGALFFASAQVLEAKLPDPSSGHRSAVVLVLRDVDDLGSTVIRYLQRYASDLQQNQSKLFLTGVNENLRGQLERTGLLARLGQGSVFLEEEQIGAALNKALFTARDWIEQQGGSS